MLVFISIISVIILFLIIILFSSAKVSAVCTKDEEVSFARVTISFWFFKFTLFDSNNASHVSKPQKDTEEQKEETDPKKSLDDIKGLFDALCAVLHSLKKRFTISLFSMDMRIGTGDAATTGIITGSAYGVIYYMLGAADSYFVLKKHHASVTPDFDKECFYIDFKGNFSLRIIYALITLSKILPILKSA